MSKRENYHSAVNRLCQAAEAYLAKREDELYRGGLIQRFEFTTELAWKAVKEYLTDQGVAVSITTPRAILKEAYAAGMIQHEAVWNDFLSARNLTSHAYDQSTAEMIARKITADFLPELMALDGFFTSQNARAL